MPFIALYVTVCTVGSLPSVRDRQVLIHQLGLSFSDTADVAKHFDPEEVPGLVDQWYSGVRAVSDA